MIEATAINQDLGRNLITDYHGPWWTAEELALLGTASDEEVAGRTARTVNAVRLMRERLGIPRVSGGVWRKEELVLLGALPDQEVAEKLGRTLSAVTQKRCSLGIGNLCDGRRSLGSR